MDVLIKRINENNLETTFYQKPTGINIYINWNAQAPPEWKIGTIRKLIKRVKVIRFDESLQNEKIKYLAKVLHEVKSFPISIINNTTTRA